MDSELFIHRSITIFTFFAITEKQGISAKFLQYFQKLDDGLGKQAFGPDQKVTTAVQSKVDEQIKHAKTIDETKGYSKIAHDVRFLNLRNLCLTTDFSIVL